MHCRPLALIFLSCALSAQDAGRKVFETRCVACHGGDGNLGELASSILARIAASTDAQLTEIIRAGVPGRGMPAIAVTPDELSALLAHLHTMRPPARNRREQTTCIQITAGAPIEGGVTGEARDDLQLRPADGRIHLLRRAGRRSRARPRAREMSAPPQSGEGGRISLYARASWSGSICHRLGRFVSANAKLSFFTNA